MDSSPLYSVETVAIDMGWHLSVKVFRALSWTGNVAVGDDPDGIVTDALFLDSAACAEKMAANGLWVREPLLTWLSERWSDHRAFNYLLEGTNRAAMTVTRQ